MRLRSKHVPYVGHSGPSGEQLGQVAAIFLAQAASQLPESKP
jgi:hypothetical protein